jgi:excisionase family DNA binding protein
VQQLALVQPLSYGVEITAGLARALPLDRQEVSAVEQPAADLQTVPPGLPQTVLIDHAVLLLGVSKRTVYYMIRDGRLRTIRTRCGSQRVLMSSLVAVAGKPVSAAPIAAPPLSLPFSLGC